jgi:dsRNA-specific ribonuclease
MREFYHPAKAKGLEVPHILGLTASPIISSSTKDLDALEALMDARCRAPKIHREELLSHVNIPEMSILLYGPPETAGSANPTGAMSSLRMAYKNMDITKDPTILALKANKSGWGRNKLRSALKERDTFAQGTMKSFCHSSMSIFQQLGPWAADFYIHQVVTDLLSATFKADGTPINATLTEDILYLGRIFSSIDAPPPATTPGEISLKMQQLVQTLHSHDQDLTGIIFVQERTTAVVMTHLLQHHPMLRGRFNVASVVGNSQAHTRKRSCLELSAGDAQQAVQGFRQGKINLLVATTVLEEGIDVPACNLVICFEKPQTLKSFIQRRGRARMNTSKLILLLDNESESVAADWRRLELEMKARYEDETRQIQIIQEIEDSEHPDYPPLEVEGEDGRLARLTIDDAKAHLQHFCATLSSRKFVDFSPYYVLHTVGSDDDPMSPSALFKATVHLPVSLPPELRLAESIREWRSEQNACKDAAFQAYQALYQAGLVNEHLLPLREAELFKEVEARPGVTICRQQMDPWPMIALAWNANKPLHRRTLRFANADTANKAEFDLLLPVPIPQFPILTLYWDARQAWEVSIIYTPGRSNTLLEPPSAARNDMSSLVTLAYGHRGERYAVTDKRHIMCVLSRAFPQGIPAVEAIEFETGSFQVPTEDYLIRDVGHDNHPYFYAGWLPTKPPAELIRKPSSRHDELPQNEPYVVVKHWPKKTAWFHRPAAVPEPTITKPHPRVLQASVVKVDAIPSIYARFGMCIPSLEHALEVYFVAQELMTQCLEQLQLTDLELVASAICTPAARMPSNYERVEFLGDCVLKLTATSNCLAHRKCSALAFPETEPTADTRHSDPNWPEGPLSIMKDVVVSNWRLAKACLDVGLDRYIITKAPSQDKWKPIYVEDHLHVSISLDGKRTMSTKTLADVVEALVGVSYLSGGLPKALECVALFMPKEKWQSIGTAREALYDAAPADVSLPPILEPLLRLLGYSFRRPSLLVEATTHSSYRVPGTHACLERLEFFGDSLIEYLIVRRLFAVADPKPLEHWRMHLLKTALVNADFLAFRVMEWAVVVERNEVVDAANDEDDGDGDGNDPGGAGGRVSVVAATAELPLWSFMAHSSWELALSQKATARRHATLRGEIREAMAAGDNYPWALLARLQAQKYYSDLFESLLGAVYVDSGSFEECDALLERAGVLPYLERMLRDGVKVWHPKEELGQLAGTDKVRYVIDVKEGEDDGAREFQCRVVAGERVIADVRGGVSREEVKIRAAEEGIRFYEGLGRTT